MCSQTFWKPQTELLFQILVSTKGLNELMHVGATVDDTVRQREIKIEYFST